MKTAVTVKKIIKTKQIPQMSKYFLEALNELKEQVRKEAEDEGFVEPKYKIKPEVNSQRNKEGFLVTFTGEIYKVEEEE